MTFPINWWTSTPLPPGSEEGKRERGTERRESPSAHCLLLPTLIGEVLYNRARERFGKRDNNKRETTVGEGCRHSCRSKLTFQRKIKTQRLTHPSLPLHSINR